METKHTPGPWRTAGRQSGRVVCGDNRTVCTSATVDDARLIASAPDLLAALAGIADRLTLAVRDGDTARVIRALEVARAALARARGEG